MPDQRWTGLTLVQVSAAFSFPVLLLGHTLALQNGFAAAATSIIVGNGCLMLLGVIMGQIAYRHKATTVETACSVFGPKGHRVFAWLLAPCLVSWFGLQADMMAHAMQSLLHNTPFPILAGLCGASAAVCSLRGIKGAERAACALVPLFLLLGVNALIAGKGMAAAQTAQAHPLSGLSPVLAMGILAVVDLPTFLCRAERKRDATLPPLLLFGIAVPGVELAGALLGHLVHEQDMLRVLTLGPCGFLSVPFLLLSCLSAMILNIYSGSIAAQPLLPRLTFRQRILALSCVGTAAACINLLPRFTQVLEAMGSACAAFGAVILMHSLLSRKSAGARSFSTSAFATTAGTAAGLVCLIKGSLWTPLPVVDAFVTSAAASAVAVLLQPLLVKRNA